MSRHGVAAEELSQRPERRDDTDDDGAEGVEPGEHTVAPVCLDGRGADVSRDGELAPEDGERQYGDEQDELGSCENGEQ